jgi:hypothetical protein
MAGKEYLPAEMLSVSEIEKSKQVLNIKNQIKIFEM